MLMDKKNKKYAKKLDVNGKKYDVTIERDKNDFVVVRFFTHPIKWWPWYTREVYYDCDFLDNKDGTKQTLKELVINMMSKFIDLDNANNKIDEDFNSWDGVIRTNKEEAPNETENDNNNGRQ